MNRAGGNVATGIDIGSDGVRVVQVCRSGHTYSILKTGRTPLAELGRLEDSKSRDARVAMILRNTIKQARIRPAGGISTVSSRRTLIKYTRIPPVPSWKLKMLMKYEIDSDDSGKEGNVAADFRILDLPVISDRYTVLVAMVQKEAVHQHMEMLREAGVKPMDITIAPVGQYESLAHSCTGPMEGVSLVVSVGAEFTDLVFMGGRKFYFARTMPFGGRAFTDAVAEEMGTSFQEAEDMKLAVGVSLSVGDDPSTEGERVSNALVGPAEQLVSAIHSAVLFCRAQTKMVDMEVSRIFLSGGGGVLKGLDEFLSSRLELPVAIVDPLEDLDLSKMPESQRNELLSAAPSYAQAIGLALAGLKEESFFFSVFPEEVKKKRRFLQREIFLWYAAAMFLIAVGVLSVSLMNAKFQRRDYLWSQKQHMEIGGKRNEALQGLVDENRMWSAKVASLEERLVAGRKIVEAMAALKNVTPDEIRLIGFSTDGERTVMKGSRRSYMVKRWLYVKGIVKSPGTPAAGEEVLRSYTEKLRRQALFSDAKIQPAYAYRNDQVYFEMKIDLSS